MVLVNLLAAAQREYMLLREGIPSLPDLFFSSVEESGSTIYDENGQELIRRVPVTRADGRPGYIDLALDSALGNILLAVGLDRSWDEAKILREAKEKWPGGAPEGSPRFVAFSYPKVGVQFGEGRREPVLEVPTGRLMPGISIDDSGLLVGGGRWSLLDSIPELLKEFNRSRYEDLLRLFGVHIEEAIGSSSVVSKAVQYSREGPSHATCFERRTEDKDVFCVPACMQMVLEFYRYQFCQENVAKDLGLALLGGGFGDLPCGSNYNVPTLLEKLTGGALVGDLNACNNADFWNELKDQIAKNRPLILITPGHAQAVHGFSEMTIAGIVKRWLQIADPGENVSAQAFIGHKQLTMVTVRLRHGA